MSGIETQRLTTARLTTAQKVALSIGGGVVLVLAGASGAHAETTGDADSAGNQSDSGVQQPFTVKGGSGAIVLRQDGGIDNAGGALATTGDNEADTIGTGSATGSGNNASSSIAQPATISATGSGAVVVDQHALILNDGLAIADTGGNVGANTTGTAAAIGNTSVNGTEQLANISGTGLGAVVVHQVADIDNIGDAEANTGFNRGRSVTGNASAVGNHSSNASGQGSELLSDSVGVAVVSQTSRTRNRGLALATTGWNVGSSLDTGDAVASGNIAANTSTQAAVIEVDDELATVVVDQDLLIDNFGDGTADTGNNNGGAKVLTGTAEAGGNAADNTGLQATDIEAGDTPAVVDQDLLFENEGLALANTGLNF